MTIKACTISPGGVSGNLETLCKKFKRVDLRFQTDVRGPDAVVVLYRNMICEI